MATAELAVPYQNQKYAEIKKKLLASKSLFEDKFFPAVNSSMYYDEEYREQLELESEIEWLRPGEIVPNPALLVGGANRFDIKQGQVGDCWLLAAVAALAESKSIFKMVVPDGQEFDEDYAGIFRFRFWRYGTWTEVCIDDRLPCHRTEDGPELLLMQSEEKNEFWSALLEKAYAKINGTYQALEGGATIEAMEDFTGGVAEIFDLKKLDPKLDLFEVMHKSHNKGSLMGCSLVTGKIEDALENGLISGHAYTITGVYKNDEHNLKLIRCRNPWGEVEWNGAWSDDAEEWDTVDAGVKKELFCDGDDGEFWMCWDDFISNWTKVEICNLGADSAADGSEAISGWNFVQFEGRWMPNASAGGCIKNKDTFAANPQFLINLQDGDDDDDDLCTTLIALMQKDRRKGRAFNLKMLAIGFMLYKAGPEEAKKLRSGQQLGREFFYKNKPCNKVVFSNPRELSVRLKLEPGDYVLIPSTFGTNEQGDFILRVFSEGGQNSVLSDNPSDIDEERAFASEQIEEDEDQADRFFNFFKRVARDDCEIDTWELQGCLDEVFYKDKALTEFNGFSNETCKVLISLMDDDLSGQLGFDEFTKLWRDLSIWKAIYKMYDEDKSGTFDGFELREALTDSGFNLSAASLGTVVRVFSDRDGQIRVDGFVRCMATLKRLAMSIRKMRDDKGIKLTLDDCIANFL